MNKIVEIFDYIYYVSNRIYLGKDEKLIGRDSWLFSLIQLLLLLDITHAIDIIFKIGLYSEYLKICLSGIILFVILYSFRYFFNIMTYQKLNEKWKDIPRKTIVRHFVLFYLIIIILIVILYYLKINVDNMYEDYDFLKKVTY